jgi:hypothetical protein
MTTETQVTETQPAATPPIEDLIKDRPDLQRLHAAGETDFVREMLGQPAPEAKPAEQKPAEATPAQTTESKPAEGEPKPDDAEPGEVRIGDDGRVRDVRGRFVPIKAMHEERQRRQALEAELKELRAKQAAPPVAQPAAAAATTQQPKSPFEEADIDPAQDLVGAIGQAQRRQKWQVEQHNRAREETTAALTEQQVGSAYQADTARFVTAKPDYPKAFEHMVRARAAELVVMGMDQAEIAKQIKDDHDGIVRFALAKGRSAAQVFYEMAVARGYKAEAAPQQATIAAPAVAATTQAKPQQTTAQQILASVQAGQASSTTLSGAGSGAGAAGLTLDQFMAMSVEDIAALKATPSGKAQLRAIGVPA